MKSLKPEISNTIQFNNFYHPWSRGYVRDDKNGSNSSSLAAGLIAGWTG